MSERSYIDAILSTEYDECNIAAADAARRAHEITGERQRSYVKSVHPVGHFSTDGLVQYFFNDIGYLEIDHPAVVGGEATLSVVQDANRYDAPVGLAVTINRDTLVPIATFQKRANGQCPYVQLGQEIADDNLVVTPDAPRAQYVEAIRAILLNPAHYKAQDLIAALVKAEIDTYQAEVEAAFAPLVCRLAKALFRDKTLGQTTPQDIYILHEGGFSQGTRGRFQTKSLEFVSMDPGLNTVHGRGVELVLAQEVKTIQEIRKASRWPHRSRQESRDVALGDLQLIALVRGGIGLKLARFSPAGQVQVMLGESEEPADGTTLALLLQTLPIDSVRSRQIIRGLKSKYLNTRESGGKSVWLQGEVSGAHVDVSVDWGTFRAISSRKVASGHIHDALTTKDDQLINKLWRELQIGQRFDTLLGPGQSETEKLLVALGSLAAKKQLEHTGVLSARKVGKTETSVETSVTLVPGERRVRVVINGRPTALDGFEPVTLFDETLHLDMVNDIPTDKIKEMAEVIGTICLRRQSRG